MRRNDWLYEQGFIFDKDQRDMHIERVFCRFMSDVGLHQQTVEWIDLPKQATVAHCAEWLREKDWVITVLEKSILIKLHEVPRKE